MNSVRGGVRIERKRGPNPLKMSSFASSWLDFMDETGWLGEKSGLFQPSSFQPLIRIVETIRVALVLFQDRITTKREDSVDIRCLVLEITF